MIYIIVFWWSKYCRYPQIKWIYDSTLIITVLSISGNKQATSNLTKISFMHFSSHKKRLFCSTNFDNAVKKHDHIFSSLTPQKLPPTCHPSPSPLLSWLPSVHISIFLISSSGGRRRAPTLQTATTKLGPRQSPP